MLETSRSSSRWSNFDGSVVSRLGGIREALILQRPAGQRRREVWLVSRRIKLVVLIGAVPIVVGLLSVWYIGGLAGRPRPVAAIRQVVTVPGDRLEPNLGQTKFTGSIQFSVVDVEELHVVEGDRYRCGGTMRPKGKFIAVYFTVKSDLNQSLNFPTQVIDELQLVDKRRRSWRDAEDFGGNCQLTANVLAHRDPLERPASSIGAGFTGTSAIVFDVPTDAEDFTPEWAAADVRIYIGNYTRAGAP